MTLALVVVVKSTKTAMGDKLLKKELTYPFASSKFTIKYYEFKRSERQRLRI
jgi:hypothetical protein